MRKWPRVHPKILKVLVDPTLGLRPYQARQIAFGLELERFLQAVCEARYQTLRFLLVQGLFASGSQSIGHHSNRRCFGLGCESEFDANALFRHPDVVELRDLTEEDPKEVEVQIRPQLHCLGRECCLYGERSRFGYDYDGYHQALRRVTANFLDVGGGATEEQVENAFRILVSDDAVKAILVNIFGGIMKCDVITTGIVNAARKLEMKVPLVVRLEGTNVEEGKQILADSGLTLEPADSLAEAAEKIVQLAALSLTPEKERISDECFSKQRNAPCGSRHYRKCR